MEDDCEDRATGALKLGSLGAPKGNTPSELLAALAFSKGAEEDLPGPLPLPRLPHLSEWWLCSHSRGARRPERPERPVPS